MKSPRHRSAWLTAAVAGESRPSENVEVACRNCAFGSEKLTVTVCSSTTSMLSRSARYDEPRLAFAPSATIASKLVLTDAASIGSPSAYVGPSWSVKVKLVASAFTSNSSASHGRISPVSGSWIVRDATVCRAMAIASLLPTCCGSMHWLSTEIAKVRLPPATGSASADGVGAASPAPVAHAVSASATTPIAARAAVRGRVNDMRVSRKLWRASRGGLPARGLSVSERPGPPRSASSHDGKGGRACSHAVTRRHMPVRRSPAAPAGAALSSASAAARDAALAGNCRAGELRVAVRGRRVLRRRGGRRSHPRPGRSAAATASSAAGRVNAPASVCDVNGPMANRASCVRIVAAQHPPVVVDAHATERAVVVGIRDPQLAAVHRHELAQRVVRAQRCVGGGKPRVDERPGDRLARHARAGCREPAWPGGHGDVGSEEAHHSGVREGEQLLEPVRRGSARQVAEERVPADREAVRPRPGVPAFLRDLRQCHERQQRGDEDALRGTVLLGGPQQQVVGDVGSDPPLHVFRIAEPRAGERAVERRDIEPVKRVGNDRGDGLAECGLVPRVGAQHGTELRPRGRDPVRVSREQLAVVPVEQLRRRRAARRLGRSRSGGSTRRVLRSRRA